jgi:predicted ATPase/DNA-binding XRE family transcriptional regulator
MERTHDGAFGLLLRRLRREAELTQEELAERAGLSVRGIGDLERGVSQAPYRSTVLQIAEALHLSAEKRSALLRASRRGSAARARPARLIPLPPTPLLGRERDVAEVRRLLERPITRLVTLTGPGGVGKTRVALEVAAQLQPLFQDDLVVLPLASLRDPGLVVPTIARALGLRDAPNQSPLEQLVAFLGTRRVALILDNLEHLLEAASPISRLLSTCPELRVVATSRAPIHIQGEHEYPIQPLATADPARAPAADDLRHYPAVQLFTQRAMAVRPDFRLTDANAGVVAQICHRLDGLPLAVELAAARIKLFPPQALLERLAHPLALLTDGPKDLPARQQTLRNTMEWSYALLTGPEQTLFARLAVFLGGFTMEAAEDVCNPDGTLDLLAGLASLVDQSLLRQEGEAEPRLHMLETIREFAEEKLAACGDAAQTRSRHAQFFLRSAVAQAGERPDVPGVFAASWADRLDVEMDNLRAAMRWLLRSGDTAPAVQLMLGLVALWNYRGYWAEGRRWLSQVLEQADVLPAAERAKACDAAGRLAWRQHDFAAAIAHHTEARRLFQELEDVAGATRAMVGLAGVHLDQGNYEQARHLYEASLIQFRELGQLDIVLECMSNLGIVAICEGDLDRADVLLHEVLQAWRTTGTPGSACWPLVGLGRIALDRGDPQSAKDMLREALELAHAHRYLHPLGGSLNALAETALAEGCPERAARLYGAVERAYEELGVGPSQREPTRREQFLAAGRRALGEEAWQRAWAAGRQMTLNQAVEYALSEDESSASFLNTTSSI